MIDMDYTNVLICNNTHGDMFDYKKALLRVYFEYVWFRGNHRYCDNVNVNMEFYNHVRIETDNIRKQYIESIEQIIFYKQYIKVYQKIYDQEKKKYALNILSLKCNIPFDIVNEIKKF